MALPNCFLDSFNHYVTNDLYGLGNGMKWSGLNSTALTTNTFISTGTGLFGNSLRIIANSSSNNGVNKIFSNTTTWVIGFRFRTTSFSGGTTYPIQIFDSGTAQVFLQINSNGTISVTRAGTAVTGGTSTNTISINTWYYIEMMVTISASISANTWQVNVNGVQWVNVTTGQSSKNSANTTANQISFATGSSFSSATMDYCDLYIDGGGLVNGGSFWGDTKIECRWPVATGTYSAWTPNGGLAVGCVNDETPNGDLNYISDNTINDRSTYLFQSLGTSPSSVMCVQVVHDSRKADAGIKVIADYCVSNGTGVSGIPVYLGNTYQMYTNVLAQDPHTIAAWTPSGLNVAEFGVQEIN